MRTYLTLPAVALSLTGIPTSAEPLPALPAYTAAYQPQSVDERGMWMQADERERELRDSPLRIKGPIEIYVRDVLCREVGADRCAGTRVYVMEIPAFNASMMPNGAMEVWSGLLLRARNEAELAAVLGHEFAHFELRHSLLGFKAARSTSDLLTWIAVLGGLSGMNTGYAQLGLIGSFYRFNRQQEKDADLLGLKYMASSGYPTIAASQIWQSLMAEDDAREVGRQRRSGQHYSAGFFDTHPTESTRATYLATEAAKLPPDGDPRPQALQTALYPYLPRFLDAQVKLNDFGGSDYILANLAARDGWTADLLFARGELYRARGNPRDLQSAAQFYREAATAGFGGAELQRSLGMALLRNGQVEDGRKALSEYLKLRPNAGDATAVAALLTD